MNVFVACPANLPTGGTELLHQFCSMLAERDVNSYIVYQGVDRLVSPVPERFEKYNVKYISEYVDSKESILVLPETQIHLVDKCKQGIAVIWWLSVDGYKRRYRQLIGQNEDIFGLENRANVLHFVQSEYAYDYVKKTFKTEQIEYLKDYINDEIADFALQYKSAMNRENIVLFNPKKGGEKLKPLILSCRKDIKWVALTGFSPLEMAGIMCSSKVYIDFGHHPGKDRIPREAALCGTCIITNRVGSAAYNDVEIPEKYKIEDENDIQGILNIIYDMVDNYESISSEFENYRKKILGEKEEFQHEMDEFVDAISKKTSGGNVSTLNGMNEQFSAINNSIIDAIEQLREYFVDASEAISEDRAQDVIRDYLDADYMMEFIKETIYGVSSSILNNDEQGQDNNI